MSLFQRVKKDGKQTFAKPLKPSRLVNESRDCFGELKPKLPQNFAQNVLELEMRMEHDEMHTIQNLSQLNELYRIAIEYYAQFDGHKAKHFQKKLSNLLSSPLTLKLMDEKVKTNSPTKNDTLNKVLQLEIGKFNMQAETVVQSLLECGKVKQAKTERMIKENIEKQETLMLSRIEQRCRSRKRSEYSTNRPNLIAHT